MEGDTFRPIPQTDLSRQHFINKISEGTLQTWNASFKLLIWGESWSLGRNKNFLHPKEGICPGDSWNLIKGSGGMNCSAYHSFHNTFPTIFYFNLFIFILFWIISFLWTKRGLKMILNYFLSFSKCFHFSNIYHAHRV